MHFMPSRMKSFVSWSFLLRSFSQPNTAQWKILCQCVWPTLSVWILSVPPGGRGRPRGKDLSKRINRSCKLLTKIHHQKKKESVCKRDQLFIRGKEYWIFNNSTHIISSEAKLFQSTITQTGVVLWTIYTKVYSESHFLSSVLFTNETGFNISGILNNYSTALDRRTPKTITQSRSQHNVHWMFVEKLLAVFYLTSVSKIFE